MPSLCLKLDFDGQIVAAIYEKMNFDALRVLMVLTIRHKADFLAHKSIN
jgi:hypothetical protein